ncbi:Cubilin, partial [Exaiptasia diaphana]
FEHFDLENSVNCSQGDYVEVTAGEKSLGRFCGSNLPQSITTSEKKLRVRFVSDAFVTGKGFKITWSTNAPTSLAVQLHGFQPMAMALAVIASVVFILIM